MAYECDAFISDYYSTSVDRSKDIQAIAHIVLQDGIITFQQHRDDTGIFIKQKSVADLFVDGQNAPDFIRRIAELKGTWSWDAIMRGKIDENDRILLDRDDEWREESGQR